MVCKLLGLPCTDAMFSYTALSRSCMPSFMRPTGHRHKQLPFFPAAAAPPPPLPQTTLLPLLIDSERVEERHQHLLRSMILMEAPASRQGLGFGAASAPAPGSGAGSSGSASDWDTGGSALTQTGPRSGGNSSSRSSSSSTAAGGGGSGTLYYGPAAAANFRTNLLRDGEVDDAVLARVAVPTLLLCSARDRLLPSIVEGGCGVWRVAWRLG